LRPFERAGRAVEGVELEAVVSAGFHGNDHGVGQGDDRGAVVDEEIAVGELRVQVNRSLPVDGLEGLRRDRGNGGVLGIACVTRPNGGGGKRARKKRGD